MGCGGGGDAAGSSGVLRRIPEGERPLRRAGGGLSAALHEPERAVEAGRSGDGASVGSRGPVAPCAHHGAARRRCQSGAPGHARRARRVLRPRTRAGCSEAWHERVSARRLSNSARSDVAIAARQTPNRRYRGQPMPEEMDRSRPPPGRRQDRFAARAQACAYGSPSPHSVTRALTA